MRRCSVTGCFLRSVFGLVSVVSVDCAAPWRLQVNPALSWFHFINPLMLLLLYNTVANLWRNQVTPLRHLCDLDNNQCRCLGVRVVRGGGTGSLITLVFL